jgi:hypothetical protein
VPGVMPRISFLRRGPEVGSRSVEEMRRNLMVGILKVNFWWHSRQTFDVVSPLTETIPGGG